MNGLPVIDQVACGLGSVSKIHLYLHFRLELTQNISSLAKISMGYGVSFNIGPQAVHLVRRWQAVAEVSLSLRAMWFNAK